jgi:hypothetical protein
MAKRKVTVSTKAILFIISTDKANIESNLGDGILQVSAPKSMT